MPSSTAKSERLSQAARAAIPNRPRDPATGRLLAKVQPDPNLPGPKVAAEPPLPATPETPATTRPQRKTTRPSRSRSAPVVAAAGGDAEASAPFRGRGLARLRGRRQRSTS